LTDRSSRAIERASPEALFVLSGLAQYTGAVIATQLFDELRPATVAWLRVLSATVILVAVTWGAQRGWTAAQVRAAAVFGIATAFMNLFFYLAIDRIDLGKSVVIEFIGPIAVAAAFTRSARNAVALALATLGVVILSGVEIDDEPLGLLFIFCASALWAVYIVVGPRVAAQDRGLGGLAMALAIGSLAIAPFGLPGSATAFTTPRLLFWCATVGALSTALAYGIDQVVMRRIPVRRFALLLALLPVTAMLLGWIGLDQQPSAVDVLGAALVIVAVVVQERDERTTDHVELTA
jgi:inner membrane transporter RhtA